MMSKPMISPTELREHVNKALKSWQQDSMVPNAIQDLHLFEEFQRDRGGNTRQTIKHVILAALDVLESQDEQDAVLLRRRFLNNELMHTIANEVNWAESTLYKKQNEAIDRLAKTLYNLELQACSEHRSILVSRLEAPTYIQPVGIEGYIHYLQELIVSSDPPWLISIEGLGGVGKTTLADVLARELIDQNIIDDFAWVTAKQEFFNAGGSIESIDKPAITSEALIELLVTQLLPNVTGNGSLSGTNALVQLRNQLKGRKHLIVIDNLETLMDIETLLPLLRRLVNPSKFVLTSRESLYLEPNVHHFVVPELSDENARKLIRQEAKLRNLPHLTTADNSELDPILETVGGNPPALRLVIGQMHVHALDTVLSDLSSVRTEKADNLYTFIYQRAWNHLDELSRNVLLVMPMVTDKGGTLEYLTAVSRLDPNDLHKALDKLVTLNLVDSRGDLHERRYTIHNLTRTFLHTQIANWQ